MGVLLHCFELLADSLDQLWKELGNRAIFNIEAGSTGVPRH